MTTADRLPSMMMDLRPCYEGYAGIPQEVRLLFAMFAKVGLPRFGGLMSGIHYTSRRPAPSRDPDKRVLAQTRVLISQDTKRPHWPTALRVLLPGAVRRRIFIPYMALTEMRRREKLDLPIDPELFEDYIWVKLFEKTLAPSDRRLIQRAEYFATELGHEYARSLSLMPRFFQRRIETEGWDIFLGATVSPYLPAAGTSMLIRYYDALPLLSPHTIGEPWGHATSHASMLDRNIKAGATFVCDSEPVREDVLRLYPKAESRVHTIPVLLASEYRPDVQPVRHLRTILARRVSPSSASARPREGGEDEMPRLIMAVSTLEPRKNYLKLFHAFEMARRMTSQKMQLVIVANPGWRSDGELTELKALVKEGCFHLSGVPQAELRILYSMSHCVVTPSRAEGFDYSGAEAMACGTPLISSDIPVHRWVYGDAAIYFDPYDEEELARHLARVVELPRETGLLADLRERGLSRARLYQEAAIRPQWEARIADLRARRGDPQRGAASARRTAAPPPIA